ncbi:MAG: hypothetical protein AAF658_09010 [Myxococcota bacterium]
MDTNKRHLNFFSHPSYVSFDTKAGVLTTRGGTRLCALNEDFLRGFFGSCEHETGPAAGAILKRCGVVFGGRLANRFETEISQFADVSVRDRAMYEFDTLLRDIWSAYGMGTLSIDWDTQRGASYVSVTLRNSPVLDIKLQDREHDDLMAGVLEGFFNHFSPKPVECVQTTFASNMAEDETRFVVIEASAANEVRNRVERGETHDAVITKLAS